MPKKVILIIIILCCTVTIKAQTAAKVYDQYLDFNLKRFEGNNTDALKLGETILVNADKLPQKSQTSFYNGLAKLYEDDSQSVEAIPLYEKVVLAQPNYYVAHRALGYLYLKPAEDLYAKMQSGSSDKETALLYKAAVLKALPHLEKAQACDPTDETFKLIKTLYTNIHDDAALKFLNNRLATLSKNCVDVLTE